MEKASQSTALHYVQELYKNRVLQQYFEHYLKNQVFLKNLVLLMKNRVKKTSFFGIIGHLACHILPSVGHTAMYLVSLESSLKIQENGVYFMLIS